MLRLFYIAQWFAVGAVVLGVAMLIFGIVLAVYLKKKHSKGGNS